MRSNHVYTGHLSRAATMSQVPVRHRLLDYCKEQLVTAVALLALAAMILVLYAVMILGLYRWTHYDPLLPPDNSTGPAITQPLE